MSLALKDGESTVVGGLGTWVYTATTAGQYDVEVHAAYQTPSSLSIVLEHNGTPFLTAPLPTTTQLATDIAYKGLTLAASDTVSVVLSSAAAIDAAPNTVKTVINIYAETY